MAWPPAPANASLVTKWLSPVKPDAKSPAKRPRHGEALPTRNLPQTPLSQQNEHNPLHILPMALAIKTRHRRNNKIAVGVGAYGSLTHGYTIQAATLHPYGSAVPFRTHDMSETITLGPHKTKTPRDRERPRDAIHY
jgi:hypothetical protein